MDFYGSLGPACADGETLKRLFDEGMTGARLNLSHTTLEDSAGLLETFWRAAEASGVRARLIIDLQGPEVRVGKLAAPVRLEEGAEAVLGTGGIGVPQAVVDTAEPGDAISLDDSALALTVTAKRADALICRVERGGVLHSRKSLAIPGRTVVLPVLTAEDGQNLDHAAEYGVTDVLQSFVSSRDDVDALRGALDTRRLAVRIMAKIERPEGVRNLDGIMEAADEICIARGDLGNAMPLWELPRLQKLIARRSREAGKPFCVVTQLLWSMQERAVPTRAEVSDIYNAVVDGASSLMLTNETAAGKYPCEAMRYLVRTAQTALSREEGPALN